MTRQEGIHQILAEYALGRQREESALRARVADACARDPMIARLRAESTALALSTARQILSGMEDPAQARQAAEAMKARGLAINAQIRERLSALNLPEDSLREHWRCPICRDTGYTEDVPARLCGCVEAAVRRLVVRDMTDSGFEAAGFEAFDEAILPEENGQRKRTLAIKTFCEEYIRDFPDTQYANLLLTGSGGLGKTFLLNCIYARALQRGIGAVRVTAYRMQEAMRKRHMGQEEEGGGDFAQLMDAPLLLIDDLGTEPMLRNITVEYLFALLNERLTARRHTVVATNLSPVDLTARYGERVSSRLLDTSRCATLKFAGTDLRLRRGERP